MEKVKITDVVKIVNNSVSPYEGVRPFLSTGDLNISKIANLELLTFEAKPSRANLNVEQGDIIVARMQGTVKVKIIEQYETDVIVSTGFLVLRRKDNIDLDYLYNYLKTPVFQNNKNALCTGATQKAINNENFAKLQIPLPPLAIQKSIAAKLDKAQEIIAYNKQLLEKYDQLTQALFIDMFGDPVKNEKGWEKVKLNEVIEKLVDVGSNGGNDWVSKNIQMSDVEDYALMIRTTNLSRNEFDKNLKFISKETYDLFKKTKVYGGEIIMNKIGSAGDFWIMPQLDRPVSLGLNQLMLTFKNVHILFFYHYFSTNYGTKLIKSKLNGAATKSITKTALRELEIYLPPMEIQDRFVGLIEKIEIQKQMAQESLAKSEQLFQSLLKESFR